MINSFTGQFDWLSNFYSKIGLCVEIEFQAAKTNDHAWKAKIRAAKSPGQAKRLGRELPPALLRPDWDDYVRCEEMLRLLRIKYSHPTLRAWLKATDNQVLIEGMNGERGCDNFWGSCRCGRVHPVTQKKCCDQGVNMLGRLTMQVREEIS